MINLTEKIENKFIEIDNELEALKEKIKDLETKRSLLRILNINICRAEINHRLISGTATEKDFYQYSGSIGMFVYKELKED